MKKRLLPILLILCLLLCACAPIPMQTPVSPAEDGLTVRFLDVGQADCALLECGGAYMLIAPAVRRPGASIRRQYAL